MIQYLLLGLLLLVAVIFLSRWFAAAQPSTLARVVKWAFVLVCAALTIYLAVTGRAFFAILPLALSLLPPLLAGRRGTRAGGAGGGSGLSEVETRYLTMSLDHDSGAMNGRVREGDYAGRELSGMSEAEVLDLYAVALDEDPESARLLETYLDRTYGPGWRSASQGSGKSGPAAADDMTHEQAYEVLGLEPGASQAEISRAHRELLKKLHPDHGGSKFLAAQINRAKEILTSS